MFLLLISTIVFALSFFSPESLVTTIAGFIVSMGLTQWLKNQTGAVGVGAVLLAFVISFAVAIVSVVASTFLSGNSISWETIPQAALQIFALATVCYRLITSVTAE